MARTAKPSAFMQGDELHQTRAREILPILVRQAAAKETISYKALSQETGIFHRKMSAPLGFIGETLGRIARKWRRDVPPIQALVINSSSNMPGEGFDPFLEERGLEWHNPIERRAAIEEVLAGIYAYPYWDRVLDACDLSPSSSHIERILNEAKNRGGEGDDHRRLKKFVSKNPKLVGLPEGSHGAVEYRLPSGDSVDVVFERNARIHAVEIKPFGSDAADIARGLFQCVKYREVLRAVATFQHDQRLISVCLCIGGQFPKSLIPLRNSLAIPVYENLASSGLT